MSAFIFIDPKPQCSAVPPTSPVPQPRAATPPPTWHDYAAEKNWDLAVIHRLRDKERKAYLYWQIVNEIVAESRQTSRADIRAATMELLEAIKQLRKQKRLMIWRRRYLTVLDYGEELLPVEDFFKLPVFTVTGPDGEQSTIRVRFRDH